MPPAVSLAHSPLLLGEWAGWLAARRIFPQSELGSVGASGYKAEWEPGCPGVPGWPISVAGPGCPGVRVRGGAR
eukprot:339846-Pyramimonas_sp.AAC.1